MSSVHEKQKPFECDFCGYRGSTKANLKSHVTKIHFNDRFVKTDLKKEVQWLFMIGNIHEWINNDHYELRREKLN